MANMMKSFRFKMIALFALSMVLAATVTYIIYKGLQLYYKTMVRYEEPLAQFRSMVRNLETLISFNFLYSVIYYLFFF